MSEEGLFTAGSSVFKAAISAWGVSQENYLKNVRHYVLSAGPGFLFVSISQNLGTLLKNLLRL